MDYREKIKNMKKAGKINSEQAIILLKSLDESEERSKNIFKQVSDVKQTRIKKAWGSLGFGTLIVLILIAILVFVGSSQKIGRDTIKALKYFNAAGIYLEEDNYEEAARLYQKGVNKASRYPLGYSLLGNIYKIIYEKTQEAGALEKSKQAFMKYNELREKSKEGENMSGTGIFFLFIFIVLILGAICILFLTLYNILVKREEGVNEAWAQIGNLYQRKNDLIPALLDIVNQYASHEKQTLSEIIEARSDSDKIVKNMQGIASSDDKYLKEVLKTQGLLNSGLGKVKVLTEQYPDLKANISFISLQEQVEQTEDGIAKTKKRYNGKVKTYNAGLNMFPMNLMAALFNFKPKVYLEKGEIR